MSTDLVPAAQAAVVKREEFGSAEMVVRGETASSAVAAREQAAIQARHVMAERHPRSIPAFRLSMLDECKRPGFASVARYGKPVGKERSASGQWVEKKVYGPSIRFIEAAIRNFKNLSPEVFTVFDSPQLRIVRVTVSDLEANICYATEIQIEKQVERRGEQQPNRAPQPPKGREVLGERLNTYGDTVYIVRATEDEVLVKQNAIISKAIRTQAQRLLPGDVVEECMAVVIKTMADEDAKDPQAAVLKLLDAFHEQGVEPADLEEWAGKKIDRFQPKDYTELRAIFTSIRDGETSWNEVMADKNPSGSREAAAEVAKNKLAAINMKQAEKAQAQPRATHAADQGEPGEPEPQAPVQDEQSSKPKHTQDLEAWALTMGPKEFWMVMGNNGYDDVETVTLQQFKTLEPILAERAQDLNKSKETMKATTRAKLQFGKPATEQK